MLSLPRAPSTRAALRQQLADHMFELASDIRWQQSLRNLEGPEAAASSDVEAAPSPPPASAAVDPPDAEAVPQSSTQGGRPPQRELDALRWASGCRQSDDSTLLYLHSRLSAAIIAEQVAKHTAHVHNAISPAPEPRAKDKAVVRRAYRTKTLKTKLEYAKTFLNYAASQGHRILPEGAQLESGRQTAPKLPQGVLAKFIRTRPDLHKSLQTKEDVKRHRDWLRNGLMNLAFEGLVNYRGRCVRARGPESSGSLRKVQDKFRRRRYSAINRGSLKAPAVRQGLFEWFSTLRHSLEFKVRTRFPPKLAEIKAKQLVQDYCAACLKSGVRPNPPVIGTHWLSCWRAEYRVSFRRPNRKFKVPRAILEDRLRVFWCNVIKVRQLAQLVLGYDLDIVNMDQSPFHINESG